MKKKRVWVVGSLDDEYGWALCGIFTEEKEAVKRCTSPNHFVGPVFLDELLGGTEENVEWPGVYFPWNYTWDLEDAIIKKYGIDE